MRVIIRRDYGPDVPVRTKGHPSPPKQSASNRQPAQPHTRGHVDNAIQHELAEAQFIAGDLADHMFGHLVPTDMAKDILKQFIADGVVEIYDSSSQTPNKPLGPKSKRVRKALAAAFKDARAHGCIRSDSDAVMAETQSVQADKKQGKGKKSKKHNNPYSWRWRDFPREPIGEDKLVAFLNHITDRALEFAKPRLDSNCKVRNRFAAPEDKYHGVPLSYEPDGEDMRPDFLVLPVEAFSPDFKTVYPKYVNFTALRAVGESKNKDFTSGLDQVHRYARGIRRAQPWVHFVVALTVTRSRLALVRGDGSGTERLELALSDGRGCIELIRILLGIALAEGDDLGQSSEVELETKERSCNVSKAKARPPPKAPPAEGHYRESKTTASSSQLYSIPGSLSTHDTSQPVLSSSGLAPHISDASVPSSAAVSSNSKRSYSEVDYGDDAEEDERQPAKKANRTEVPVVAFIPVAVYGHKCLGILFTASSIRGRGTAVFCVVDLKDESKLLALKTSWQDLERVAEQNEVLERLEERKSEKSKLQQSDPHANLVVPSQSFIASRKNETCTTLGAIRAFLDHQLAGLRVENRVLSVSLSELKRPVKYFWGVHDFVRGVRGALLGHRYLTSIGVLHRDISENNVVLARRPGEERGYLIDFDMAKLQEREKPTPTEATLRTKRKSYFMRSGGMARSSSPIPSDETKPIKALRTGTISYMSFNVLFGGRHTQFDDLESFLYVVFLFFFSYAGPLSKEELRDADIRGFVQPTGSGRFSHTRRWPDVLQTWSDARKLYHIAQHKDSNLATRVGLNAILNHPEIKHGLLQNWASDLHDGITSLFLSLWTMFADSRVSTGILSRTEVTHEEFIDVLDRWLEAFDETEQKFSNCPFT